MQRITQISLQNFRAFGDQEPTIIDLAGGENLLIYGENGSGKTSLYSALLGFLEASANPTARFITNLYAQKDENGADKYPGHVRVSFAYTPVQAGGPTTIYQFGSAPLAPDVLLASGEVGFLRKANQARGFLSYREIVRTYLSADVRNAAGLSDDEAILQGKRKKRAVALFKLLVETLLAHHQLKTAQRTVGEELAELYDYISRKNNSWMFERANARLSNPFASNSVEREFVDLIKSIEMVVNRYLHEYFANALQLEFTVFLRRESSENWNRDLQTELHVKAYLGGQLFAEDYTDFLNEARLSALAVCFYLAAVRAQVEPNPQPDYFKFLFLDDIFIGLDTNNRLPLLKLLNDEFVNEGYQIILTTYDREWFMLAAHWFKQRPGEYGWQQLEMYEEEVENVPGESLPACPFRPVLVPFRGSYEKATAYFKAKDYPAAGNYLRKALEEVTTSLTPYETGDAEADAKGAGNSVHARFGRLKELRELCNNPLPQDLVDDMLLYQKLVLHPSSHYNTTHSLYREELKTTFRLVQKLRDEKIYRVVRLVAAGELLRYESADPATYGRYWSECRLLDDLRVVLADGKVVMILTCTTQTTAWEWNGVMLAKDKDGNVYDATMIEKICTTDRPLHKRPGVIEHTLKPYVVGVDVLRDFHLANHPVSLNELLAKRQAGFPATVQEVL